MSGTEDDGASCVVSVRGRDGAVGVGVLVGPRHVLTCAHVVEAAVGRRPGGMTAPSGSIELAWPLLGAGGRSSGRVTTWRALPDGDIAVLELTGDAPPGARPARLVPDVPGRDVALRVFGYPDGRPSGQHADVSAAGPLEGGLVQLNARGETPDVRRGYSGGPVMTPDGAVVGIVAQAPAGGRARDSAAIPVRRILQVWQPRRRPAKRYAPADELAVLHLPWLRLGSEPEPDLDAIAGDDVWPDLVVVTGDLAAAGLPREYDLVVAFLERVAERFELPRHRIAVVPGAGDVNVKACQAYFLDAEADGAEPAAPYWPKWRHFAAAFERFYGDTGPQFTADQPWTLFEMPDLKVVVAGLNSTLPHSHLDATDGIGDEQRVWFSERVARSRNDGWFTVAAVQESPADREWFAKAFDATLRADESRRRLIRVLGSGTRAHAALTSTGQQPRAGRHFFAPGLRVTELALGLLVEDVTDITRLLHPGADVTARHGDPPYLLVTVRDPLGPVDRWPVGVVDGPVTAGVLRRFLQSADAPLRSMDRRMRSHLVYVGPAPDDDVRAAAVRHGVALHSLAEYRGVIDLDRVRERQAERLVTDTRYPPELFVVQRFRQEHPAGDRGDDGRPAVEDDALARIARWLGEPGARFVTVLGDFGRGKTFLMRQLVRELPSRVGDLEPLLLELRTLEKGPDLYDVVGQHLRRLDVGDVTDAKVRHLVTRGRVALLLDGFDELVQKVTYPTAAAYLTTLLDAATGDAKIVLTSRTQHFSDDGQVRSALLTTATGRDATRILALEDFAPDQIREFLVRHYAGDAGRAERRHERLAGIRDLLGLSRNPRMLSFIADLPDARLDAAGESSDGAIGAAQLYREILDHWLGGEVARQRFRYGATPLPEETRLAACRELALSLWASGGDVVPAAELARATATLEGLQRLGFTDAEAGHTIGSGSLLTRSGDGFGFVHRSVMEWLVADTTATQLALGGPMPTLGLREMSDLMTDFFVSLATPAAAREWAGRSTVHADPVTRANATRVRARLSRTGAGGDGEPPDTAVLNLRDQDLRDQDVAALAGTGRGLRGANLRRTVWTGLHVRNLDLTDADLTGAVLAGVEMTDVRLTGARLRGTDLTRARLERVDLTGADLFDATMTKASLLGVTGAEAVHGLTVTKLPGDRVTPVLAATGTATGAVDVPQLGLVAVARGAEVELVDAGPWYAVRVLACDGDVRAMAVLQIGDATLLATAGDDRKLTLWDPVSGERRGSSPVVHAAPVTALAVMSGEVTQLASADEGGRILLWDPRTGGAMREAPGGHATAVRALAVMRQGDGAPVLASGADDGTVLLWDLTRGRELAAVPAGDGGAVRGVVATSGAGFHAQLAILYENGSLQLWHGETTEPTPPVGRVLGLQIVPTDTGEEIVTADAFGQIDWWERDDEGRLRNRKQFLPGQVELTWFLALPGEPDGAHLLTGHVDGSVRRWHLGDGTFVQAPPTQADPAAGGSVVVALDEKHVALARSSGVHVLDVRSAGLADSVALPEGRVPRCAAALPSGSGLVVGHDDGLTLVDLADRSATHTRLAGTGAVLSLAPVLLRNGDVHVVAAIEGIPVRWSVTDKYTEVLPLPHGGAVRSVAAVPWSDGRTLIALGDGDTVVFCDLDTATFVATQRVAHTEPWPVVPVTVAGRQRLVVADGGTVRLWDPRTQSMTAAFEPGARCRAVTAVPLSGSAPLLALAGPTGLTLWNVESGSTQRLGEARAVRSLAAVPLDVCTVLLAGGTDGRVRLWRVDPDASTRAVGTVLTTGDGAAFLAADGRSYRTEGDVGDVLWWAARLSRFDAGELDAHDDTIRRLRHHEPVLHL